MRRAALEGLCEHGRSPPPLAAQLRQCGDRVLAWITPTCHNVKKISIVHSIFFTGEVLAGRHGDHLAASLGFLRRHQTLLVELDVELERVHVAGLELAEPLAVRPAHLLQHELSEAALHLLGVVELLRLGPALQPEVQLALGQDLGACAAHELETTMNELTQRKF